MWENLLDFLTNLQQLVPQGFNVSSKGTLCCYCKVLFVFFSVSLVPISRGKFNSSTGSFSIDCNPKIRNWFFPSFIRYISHCSYKFFLFFFQWPECDWIFFNTGSNSVVTHICALRHHANARSLASVSCPPTLPLRAYR